MNNINEIKEKRAALVREMQSRIKILDNPEDFKYYRNIHYIKFILEELEDLREKELDILGKK